jgi:glycine/D-amino acid oxidase-like deaminating enzyme
MSTHARLSRRTLLQTAGAAGVGAFLPRGDSAAAAAPGTITEPARQTPVVAECDLCVIGGSATGVFAAVAAARLGASVVLVENLGLLGGVATASLVNIWHSVYDTAHQRQIIAGLSTELIDRLKRRDAVNVHENRPSQYFVFNSAEMTVELDELLRESKVELRLHTRFVAPIVESGRVAAVVIEDKTGRRAIRARAFIDATGDGDLVARIPLATRRDSVLQPPTTCAIVLGLDEVQRQNKGFDLAKAVNDPRYPNALKNGFLWAAEVPGIPGARMVAGTRVHGVDCSQAEDLTRAEVEGRRQIRAMCDIVRDNFPGGKSLGLATLPARIGIRESRHAVCLHTLTEQEVLGGTRFPDAIANGTYPVDMHHNNKPGVTFRYLDGRERYAVPGKKVEERRWRAATAENPTFYQIPYRSLVPRGSTNVLVAGRLLDADRGAFGATRVMINCNQMGQAVATAAVLALRANCGVAEVPPDTLRRTLTEQGAIVI